MKEHFTEEIVEIKGNEYTLFLNRKGVVSWENKTNFIEEINDTKKVAEEVRNKMDIELKDDTDPFTMYDDFADEESESEKETAKILEMYSILFWVALYTHHKYSPTQAKELFDDFVDEYGKVQVLELLNMMLENANKDISPKKQLKNLLAQKPMK